MVMRTGWKLGSCRCCRCWLLGVRLLLLFVEGRSQPVLWLVTPDFRTSRCFTAACPAV